MIIYNADGTVLRDVVVDDNSYRSRAIMGDNNLVLYYSLAEHIEIPVGAYCEFEGETYTLMRPEAFKMRHSRNFEYTVTMESAEGWAKVWKFRNTVPTDRRLKFPLTARPEEHLQMLVDNLNERDASEPKWSIGTCIESDEVCISYDHAYCYEALGQMADAFDCEFEFDCKNKTVSLWKIEHNKENPLPLAYGQGNGFKPNVGRANYGDTPPIDILYVQGGTDNIDSSQYKAWDGSACSYLLLPADQPTLGFDGEHFDYEEGFDEANAKYYQVSADRYSIFNMYKDISNPTEDSLDCSEIYPKRVGEIANTYIVDKEQHFWDFDDPTIPDELDYNEYLIAGETMTVIFQSGMLAGKEFEISKYDHANRRFEIVPQEIDGIVMPDENTGFYPKGSQDEGNEGNDGDKYAIFHCSLPQAYIRDDATHEGAEWDIFRAAVQYMYENEDQKFTFSGELDGIWSKKDWANIGGRIVLGGYILFTNESFQPDGALLRIISVKDYINKPYSPTIELSNGMVAVSFSTTMKQLESQDVIVEQNQRDALQFTKRRFRDAQETISMLEAAINSFETNFTESISPITVQTMSLLVGDESLQFRFVNDNDERQTVYPSITYEDGALICKTNGAGIIHMTLNIDSISSSHSNREYDNNFWDIPASSTTLLPTESDKGYYLYLKARRGNRMAEFYLSDTSISMEAEDGYYYFLVGILNSEYNGERSFVTLYGYTEVLPGRITTDRVVSGDGDSYMDLVNNAFKLGSRLSFNINGDGQLVLQGTMVQSTGSTDTSYVGCYRGTWNKDYTYFQGDEVSYTSSGVTSTYRCLGDGVTQDPPPSDPDNWQVLAAGVKGADGTSVTIKGTVDSPDELPEEGNTKGDGYIIDGELWVWDGTKWNDVGQIQGPQGEQGATGNYYELRYCLSGSPTSPPGVYNNSRNPGDDWTTSMPSVPTGYYLWMISALINGETEELMGTWGSPVCVSGVTGADGADGKSPALVYRGEYDSSATYYGNDYRLDCVKYGDAYYVTRIDAGTISGIAPTNEDYWNPFGASFESIATGLLLAEWANVGGWIFRDNMLISQLGTDSDGKVVDYNNDDFTPYITLDGSTGKIYTGNGITIDADGITLRDTDGNVTAMITRQEIGGATSLDGAEESEDHTDNNYLEDRQLNSFLNTEGKSYTDTFVMADYSLGTFKERDSLMGVDVSVNGGTLSNIPTDGIRDLNGVLTVDVYCGSESIWHGAAETQSLNPFNDISVYFGSGELCTKAGVYRIVATFDVTYTSDDSSTAIGQPFYIYAYTRYKFAKQGIKRTLIGTDGFYSCWGNNMYFRCASSDDGGIRMRMGDFILRITTTGIEGRGDGQGSATSGWTRLI